MARVRSLSPDDAAFGRSPASPVPLPLSKRDKRRSMLLEKFNDMSKSFYENRDLHYRAQIQAIQTDMALIIRADPYQNKPLDDTGDEVADIIHGTTGLQPPQPGTATGDYVAQVGRFYSQFVKDTNDALETRDISLTMLWNKYQASIRELEQSHQYKIRLAQEEHRHLANTLRERLVASIKQRQARLLKEKEQLDIADSNALLLHPNQFSITNSASPGGAASNRKTRHTRHRVGDSDDLVGTAISPEKSRKRKAAFDDVDSGSSAPSAHNHELAVASPFRDAKAKVIHTQFEAPAYSIDRLFTDKELAMTMNVAAVATTHFFNKLRAKGQNNHNGSVNDTDDANVTHHGIANGDDDSGTATANEAEVEGGDERATPAASEMEHTQSHHATRGSIRNNPLADLALASERKVGLVFSNAAPVILPANVGSKANASAPTPPGLSNAEVENDFTIMTRPSDGNDDLSAKLLQTACGPLQAREYQYQPSDLRHDHAGSGPNAFVPHVDASSMSISAANSDSGARSVPMSRHGNGSSIGAGMRRTGSGMGRGKAARLDRSF